MGEALHGQEEGDPTDPVYAYNKLLEDMPQEEKATLKRNLFVNASLMQWANSEMKAERYAEARDLYERVLVEGKNDDKVNLVHVGVNLGRCYLKSGQLEKGYEFMIKPLANENLSDGLRETIFMVVAEDWTPEVEFPRVREFLDEYGRVVDSDPFEQPDAALAKVARIHDEYPGDEVVPSAWNLKGDIFAAAERAFEEIEACYLKGRETGLAMDQPETVSYALWQLVVQTAENELWDKTQQHFDEFQENYPESEYRYDALAAALPMLVHQGRAD